VPATHLRGTNPTFRTNSFPMSAVPGKNADRPMIAIQSPDAEGAPPSGMRSRRSAAWRAFWLAAAICLVLAGVLVRDYNRAPHGYVAVYVVAGLWLVTIAVGLAGGLVLLIGLPRFLGLLLVFSSVLLPSFFITGVWGTDLAGFNHWKSRPVRMQSFGPNVPASLVVYYKAGTARKDITQLQDSLLYRARADGRGKDFIPGIRMYMYLSPRQAHGHEGCAIDLDTASSPQAVESLVMSFSRSPIVFAVYKDVAPVNIPDPDAVPK